MTSRPGCRNMTLAMEGEMGLPNRQYRRPFSFCALAHAANSYGVGVCPRSTAHRRTMNPSITLGASLFEGEKLTIAFGISEIGGGCKECHIALLLFPFCCYCVQRWQASTGPDISNFVVPAAATAAAILSSASRMPTSGALSKVRAGRHQNLFAFTLTTKSRCQRTTPYG